MWRDVFLSNKEAVLDMLQRFSEDLTALQRAIRWDKGDELFDLFTRTRAVRRGIIEQGQDDARRISGAATTDYSKRVDLRRARMRLASSRWQAGGIRVAEPKRHDAGAFRIPFAARHARCRSRPARPAAQHPVQPRKPGLQRWRLARRDARAFGKNQDRAARGLRRLALAHHLAQRRRRSRRGRPRSMP